MGYMRLKDLCIFILIKLQYVPNLAFLVTMSDLASYTPVPDPSAMPATEFHPKPTPTISREGSMGGGGGGSSFGGGGGGIFFEDVLCCFCLCIYLTDIYNYCLGRRGSPDLNLRGASFGTGSCFKRRYA
jgi:hypothetical protein